jgi:hypothetical protein
MLLNSEGNEVKVPAKFNSKDNPNMFRELREIHEPKEVGHGDMFHLGTRARFKECTT